MVVGGQGLDLMLSEDRGASWRAIAAKTRGEGFFSVACTPTLSHIVAANLGQGVYSAQLN